MKLTFFLNLSACCSTLKILYILGVVVSHVKVCGSGVSHCTVCQPYVTIKQLLCKVGQAMHHRCVELTSLKLKVNQILFFLWEWGDSEYY